MIVLLSAASAARAADELLLLLGQLGARASCACWWASRACAWAAATVAAAAAPASARVAGRSQPQQHRGDERGSGSSGNDDRTTVTRLTTVALWQAREQHATHQ